MPEVDRGMDLADMKRLLVRSKTEPVNVAVGVDGKNAVLLLHKVKQPKAVSKDLEAKFKDLKNPRWGTAFVDTDADPKLVVLTLNRSASGMGQKLKKTLKGTGFSKVRIQLEDGTIDEDIGEEDEEGETEGQADAKPAAEPEAVAAKGPGQQDGGGAEQAEAQTQEQQPAFDPAPLTQRLTGLVKRMMDVIKASPDRASELKDLATKAQAALKGTDEQAATEAVDALEHTLDGAGSGGTAGTAPSAPEQGKAAPKNAVVLQKSRLAWVAARKRVEDEIGKLHDAMSKHYDGHGFGADLDKVFQSKVEPILTTLDQSLADKLNELGNNDDPSQHDKLAGEARKIIDKYESFLSSDKLIPQLDQNPFVPLQIQKTLTATLEALKKSVR
ncbi:MAG: hypothetical protein JOZ05_09290 [Acetobacteraceae bacterium]|nr:hypothetical protein [Acetobacteraceae bacterium]